MLKFDEIENLESVVSNGGLRWEECVGLLKKGVWSIEELSIEMNISRKNVSSVLNSIKKNGYEIRKIKSGKSILCVLVRKMVGGKKGLDGYMKEVKGKSYYELWNGKEGKWEKEVIKK